MKIVRETTVNINIQLSNSEWLDLSNTLGTLVESDCFRDLFFEVYDDSESARRESWDTLVNFWESL